MKHIDLFSGIGGFALAARWAGIKTVQFVEIDKFCHKVLNKNFPGVPIHDDIKTFHYSGSSPFILTGGFPCQPFSCAGKRGGKEDDRFLWPEMLRVVSESKPRWVIGENVAGFIDMGLDDCISDLENQGYEVQTFIIPACAVNAPHRRDRVWIVANRIDSIRQSRSARENKRGVADKDKQNASYSCCGGFNQGSSSLSRQESRRTFAGKSDCHAADTEKSEREQSGYPRARWEGLANGSEFITHSNRFNGHDAGLDSSEVSQLKEAEIFRVQSSSHPTSEQAHTTEQRGLHAESCSKASDVTDTGNQRLQGSEWPGSHEQRQAAHGSITECNHAWDEPWIEVATRLCRVDDGIPRRMDRVNRLKALGNAVVPQVAYQIMKAIIEVENG